MIVLLGQKQAQVFLAHNGRRGCYGWGISMECSYLSAVSTYLVRGQKDRSLSTSWGLCVQMP